MAKHGLQLEYRYDFQAELNKAKKKLNARLEQEKKLKSIRQATLDDSSNREKENELSSLFSSSAASVKEAIKAKQEAGVAAEAAAKAAALKKQQEAEVAKRAAEVKQQAAKAERF